MPGVVCDSEGNRLSDMAFLSDGDTAFFRCVGGGGSGSVGGGGSSSSGSVVFGGGCPMHQGFEEGEPQRKYRWGDHDEYQFGDITRSVLRGLSKKSSKKKKKKEKEKVTSSSPFTTPPISRSESWKQSDKTASPRGGIASTAALRSTRSSTDGPSQPSTLFSSPSAPTSTKKPTYSSKPTWSARLTSKTSRPSIDEEGKRVVPAPGPPPRLIVGNIPDILPSLVPACKRLGKQYGGIVRLTLLGEPFFAVADPSLLPPLLNLSTKSLPRQEIAPNGVFLADGATWRMARQTLQLVFTDRYMHLFLPTFERHATIFCEELSKPGVGDDFDILRRAEQQSFDVVCEAGFGMPSSTFLENEASAFARSFHTAFNLQKKRAMRLELINKLPTSANRRFITSLEHLNNTVDEIVSGCSRMSEANKKSGEAAAEGRDLLSLMMEAKHPETGETLSHENLRHQVITLLVAGHKTAALLMTWVTYEISQHPEVELELLREQASIFGKDTDRLPTEMEIKKMRYLDQTLKETLRLHPPAQSAIRGIPADEEGVTVGPDAEDRHYYIPPGSRILVNILGVHTHEAYWGKSPESFDPSRFERAEVAKHHEAQYIPFGGGARSCLGNLFALTEVKVLLSLTLRKFQVRMHPDIPIVIKASGNPLNPASGVHTVWTKRDDYEGIVDTLEGKGSLLQCSLASTVFSPISFVDDTGANASPAAVARAKRNPKLFQPVDLVYGSNQGTCQDLIETLSSGAAARGLEVCLRTLDDLIDELEEEASMNPEQQKTLKIRTLVICVSTYNGAPPDNAARFFSALAARASAGSGDLSHVEFAVFGSGNSNWMGTFGKIPKQIDANLAALGAECIVPTTVGDEDLPSGVQVAFEAFSTLLWPMLGMPVTLNTSNEQQLGASWVEASGSKGKKEDNKDKDVDDPTIQMEPDRFVVRRVMGSQKPEPPAEDAVKRSTEASAVLPERRVLMNHELQAEGSERSTRYIELELLPGESYEAGDHFEVQPLMSASVVTEFALAVGLNPSDRFILRVADDQPARLLPAFARHGAISTVEDALRHMDCTASPSQSGMLRISERATDVEEKKRLRGMALPYQTHLERYHSYVGEPCRTLPEILADFPSVMLSLADVLEILHPLRARFYSVSSSPTVLPNAVSLCVGVAQAKTLTGRVHNGVCSSYLAASTIGDHVRGRPRTSTFRLPPPAPATSIIMCCAGTGLAPFRGFLQELEVRYSEQSPASLEKQPALLFFGCRNSEIDFIHRNELETWQAKGLVTLHTAFSRENDKKKVYIQDKMSEAGKHLWDLLANQGASIMLCGDARTMAKSVQARLRDIACKCGGLSEEEATAFLEDLGVKNRLLLDVWG